MFAGADTVFPECADQADSSAARCVCAEQIWVNIEVELNMRRHSAPLLRISRTVLSTITET